MSFAKWSDAKKKNQSAAKAVEDEESSTNSDDGKVPSFSEWSNKKKNKNQQTVTSTSEDKRPQTNTGTVPSFSEWSNRKRASLALQQWAQGVDDLAGDMQDYYEDWSGGSDIEGKSKIFNRRIESLNDTTRILGMQYGDVYGVQSFLDSANSILSGNKDVVDQNLALFREQEAERENTQKELDELKTQRTALEELKTQRTALEEKAKAEQEAQRQKELEKSQAKRDNDPLSSLNVGTANQPKQNGANRNIPGAQTYNMGVGAYQKKEETYVPGGNSKPVNTGIYPSHSYQGATATTTELSDVDKQIKELDRQIREKETRLQQLEQVERRQERGKRKAELEKVSNNEDFDEYKGYQSTAVDGILEKATSQQFMGYADLTYEYINNTPGVRDAVKLRSVGTQGATDVNPFTDLYQGITGRTYNIAAMGFEFMKPEEVERYNYLYRKEGKAKAEEYLDLLQEELNERKGGKIADALKEKELLQYGYGFYAGADQFADGIFSAVNLTDDYIPVSSTQFASRDIREDLADDGFKLPDWLGGGSLGQFGYDAVNTAGNMLPSMALNIAFPGVGTAAMGVSAAGNAYQDMLNQGYSREQARAYSTWVGISEVCLEKLLNGIPQMGKSVMSEKALKNLAKLDNVFGRVAKSKGGQIIGSMISEGFEEGLQEVIEPMIKAAVTGEPVDIDTQEVWYSTLLGGFSGGMFQGVDILSQSGKKAAADIKTGKTINSTDGGVDALRKLANEMAGVSSEDMQKQIKNQTDRVDKKATNRRVGKLFDTVNTANNLNNASANQADIAKSLQSKGFTAEKANAVAEALVASYNGQNLTSAQQKLLESVKDNADVRNAIDTIMYNSESTMGQRSQNIRTFENDIRAGVISKKTGISMEEARNIVEGKFVPQEKSLAENSYEVSADGKTIDKDGNLVSIQGIASIENGRMVLQTEGGTVDAKDVIYGNRSEALVYEAVANLGDIIDTETANKLAEHLMKLGETSSEGYVQGIVEAYRCGYYGYSRDKMTGEKAMAATLTEKQRNVAYGRGEMYRNSKNSAEHQEKVDKTASRESQKDGNKKVMAGKNTVRRRGRVKGYGVTIKELNKAFNSTQKQAYAILDRIAAVTGIDIVLFQSKPDANGELRGGIVEGIDMNDSHGAFSWHNNKIYIDINAGVLNASEMGDVARYSMLRTFTHEFTHFIEKYNPEQYEAFRELVFDVMRRNGGNPDVLIDQYMNKHEDVSRDEASREVVAEAMTDILPETRFVQELAQKHKGIYAKLVEKLKEFVADIKAHFKSIGATVSKETAAVKEHIDGMVRYADELIEMFDQIAVQAVENYQAAETAQKKTAGKGGVQMQIREVGDTGKFYVQADRQVLTGDDPKAWGKQIEKYINEAIRKEQDVAIPTQDGHVLLLTGRSAYKLSDDHVASIQKKVEEFLPDDVYALKGRAATHIDELIQVARFDKYRPDTNQKHKNDIGEDGFNYFEAYFRDFDGKYYRVAFSSALNASEETVYSIGRIEKRKFPTSRGSSSNAEALNSGRELRRSSPASGGSSPKKGALKNGRKPSGSIIYTSASKSQEIKSAIQLAYEKALSKKAADEQHQDRTGTLTNRDIIAEIDGKTELERAKLKEYQEKLERSREQSRIMAEKNREADELAAANNPANKQRILQLRTEAVHARNRQQTYEGQLRSMENGVLAPLIDREKGRVLEKLRKEYGTIPKGEKAVRDDSLPVSTDGKSKVSRTARTVKGAGATPNELADQIDIEVAKGGLSYIPITNDETTQKAEEWITRKGWEAARYQWSADVRSGKVSAKLSAIGALLLSNAANAGDRTAWLDILHDYQYMGTNAGQAAQALRILKQLQPEDKLYMIRRTISQMVEDMHLGFDVVIDPEMEELYRNAETYEEEDWYLAEIQQSIADQIPSTRMDKWTALRYTMMLGNLKTQVRNIFGNVGMKGTAFVKNEIAAGIEQIAYLASGGKFKKTKSAWVSRKMLKAAKADFAAVESLMLSGGKYNDPQRATNDFINGVRDKKRIFGVKESEKHPKLSKGVNAALAPVEWYRKGTNWLMNNQYFGDAAFSKSAYARALAGFLKARGIQNSDFSKIDQALMDEARLYAVREAQEATFHDMNELSEAMAKLHYNGPNKFLRGLSITAEGIIPFRQTPANIIVRAEEYSPLGVFNSLILSARAMKKGSEITGADIVNSWSKTLTGTGLFLLGVYLHSIGLLTGGPDDDEAVENFEALNGQQNYALRIGDLSFTIDFLSPAAIPMFMGAQFNKEFQENGFQWKDIGSTITSITDPLIQMSMMQGVDNALENIKYSENNTGQLFLDSAVSYFTQGITNSLAGQIERGFEDQRMSTYVDKDGQLSPWVQRQLGKISAKTPGWDYNQIPYINAWGEEEENPPAGLNLIYNMLSPSYISKETQDEVSRELTRLNEVQSDVNVFPSTPEKTYTYKGETRNLTAEEYVALARTQGQTQRQIVENMVDSALYDGLPDAYKAKAVSLAYEYARESAQIKELDRETFSSDWMAEIQGDTAEGILKHVIKENVKNMYLSGDISAEEAIQRRIEYHGDTKEEATEKIAYWDFQVKNPEYADWREDTVTKYKDLDAKTAAHVVDMLGKLSPEDGHSKVRPIQKIEAITKDSSLSDKDKDTALRAIMDDKLEAKYDAARKMGIGTSKFATAYRKYQDTEGKGKKAKVVDYYKDAFKLSKSDAEKLYDLFDGKK